MGDPAAPWSRRLVMAGGLAALAACSPRSPNMIGSLEWAVAGPWRSPADKARDRWRHPIESLRFWGLKPRTTVVEFWPGVGWYSDILAPYLSHNGGHFYAAGFQVNSTEPAAAQVTIAYKERFLGNRSRYGRPEITQFGPSSGLVAPPGNADMVLFLRNLHNWMAAGIAEKAFRDAHDALKPGGVLGIEEHRADPAGIQDPLASDGYVQQAYAIQLAKDAGFEFQAASEINANPKDSRHHPFGVWTLPPTRLSAPRGAVAVPGFDHGPYDAIGESDRMTLRFVKRA